MKTIREISRKTPYVVPSSSNVNLFLRNFFFRFSSKRSVLLRCKLCVDILKQFSAGILTKNIFYTVARNSFDFLGSFVSPYSLEIGH